MKRKPLLALLAAMAVLLGTVFLFSAPPAADSTLPAPPAEEPGPSPETAPPPETRAADPQPKAVSDPLELMLQLMTDEQKVGQLFLARCPGETAPEDLQTYHLGGFILFGQDFDGQTPESIRATLSRYNETADLPLLIAVDEEGGTVCRVSRLPAFRSGRFLSPREYFARGGMEAVLEAENEKSKMLKSLGIQVNMGPVCDITESPAGFMYRRSLGQDPQTTARFISETVEIMNGFQLGSVLKHFPGYGNNSDTHTGIARDSRTLRELEEKDLIPFQAGIDAGCGAVLVSHTVVEAFDPELPASLSPAVHGYLRGCMGFQGVIMTDDLQMGAITSRYGAGEAAVLAILAGNDMLCSSEYPEQYRAVLEAVQSGRISREILDAAVLRVLRWKQSLGLFPF